MRLRLISLVLCLTSLTHCSTPSVGGGIDLLDAGGELALADVESELATDLKPDGAVAPETVDVGPELYDVSGEVDLIAPDLSDAEAGSADAGDVSETEADAEGEAETEVAVEFPFGELCESDEDCDPGQCLATPLGGVCTTICDEVCPPDWQCWSLDDEDLCVPSLVGFCEPCDPALPPPFDNVLCAQLDGAHVLLHQCDDEGACANGLDCHQEGAIQGLCAPPSGNCLCLPGEEGKELPCETSNEFGTCPGFRPCLATGIGACEPFNVASLEVCNGVDDDCDGLVDEAASNCAPPFCLQEGVEFYMVGGEACVDGQCVEAGTASCGLFACDKIGAFGACLTDCEDDGGCAGGSFCNQDGQCVPALPEGAVCDTDPQCNSGHCAHNVCCQAGDCCFDAALCPDDHWLQPVCDDAEVCQGHRQDAQCVNNMCQTGPVQPDDSGCDEQTLANECGAYPPVHCNGLEKQALPACSNGCADDLDCDPGFHCDYVCKPDLEDGFSCDEDSDCLSTHCEGGLCCLDGLCCDDDDDCAELFSSPAACDEPGLCQGTRTDAACVENSCSALPGIPDDSACVAEEPAVDCGPYGELFCNGDETQAPPLCPASCIDQSDCEAGFTCKEGLCEPRQDDGGPCDVATDCLSDHCSAGVCCAFGDCCLKADQCPDKYSLTPTCQESFSCQGHRMDATCEMYICGSIGPIDDDSGCSAGMLAKDCAPYPSQYCTGQPAQLSAPCSAGCDVDDDCSPDAHCDPSADAEQHVCKPDLPDGYSCDEDGDCMSGHCQNGFCCGSGDCCVEVADCPAEYATAPLCVIPDDCQGIRIDAFCEGFQCGSTATLGDDTGCGPDVLALECGSYLPSYCSGQEYQPAPACPLNCSDDDICSPGFHCDPPVGPGAKTCVADQVDGTVCDEPSDCISGHCDNGYCCSEGVCCNQASSCPDSFSTPPKCADPGSCQGFRIDAACTQATCESVTFDDDSACNILNVVDDCGLFLPVMCAAFQDQQKPECPTNCVGDEECDPGAHCDPAGLEGGETCLPDAQDGAECDEASDCESGYCANGYCCASDVCCSLAVDCPDEFWAAAVCDDVASCQGHRVDAVCEDSRCGSADVDDDSGCDIALLANDCGPFPDLHCTGEPAQPEPECSQTCGEDSQCAPDYHCDSICKPDLTDGLSCDEASDCISGHCQNGFCCASGDCCQFNYHCPPEYDSPPVCVTPESCQGTRQDRGCSNFICVSDLVLDDSACGPLVLAGDCGLFADVYCTGAKYQPAPGCPEACQWDSECDDQAHCDGVCEPDIDDGLECNEDSDCAGGHCGNGYCCAQGACCATASNCPPEFSASPQCEEPAACQGQRVDAVCTNHQCGELAVDDDSGCTEDVTADDCGLFLPVLCTGEVSQPGPACPEECQADGHCDPGAHCDPGPGQNICVPDVGDGLECDEDSDCTSGHCSAGICCQSGDCCIDAAECPPDYSSLPGCLWPADCQGQRVDATCADFVCGSDIVADDSACTQQVNAAGCGAYLDLFCTGEEDQDSPLCPLECLADDECDPGAHCDGVCLGDLPDGASCNEDSDCNSGHCNHAICCDSGDCCLSAAGCPGQYKKYPACDDAAGCQGHRVDATCDNFVCGSLEAEDDSGCGWWTEAHDCGPFLSVVCNGSVQQEQPLCPTVCLGDDECDASAHCDGACLADLGDGAACDEDSDCQSFHCQNGFCCSSGDCCALANHCPGEYSESATCQDPQTCQGSRLEAACQANVCVSLEVADDSACDGQSPALDCGFYDPVYCSGDGDQQPPSCPVACLVDEECTALAHCDGGHCLADLADGKTCDENGDCTSGYCQNGFCCETGDCCFVAGDCPAEYASPSECISPPLCEGERQDATCELSVCGTVIVGDDAGCDQSVESDDCGLYKAVHCNGQVDQLPPACANMCTYDSQCDPDAHCEPGNPGSCQPD